MMINDDASPCITKCYLTLRDLYKGVSGKQLGSSQYRLCVCKRHQLRHSLLSGDYQYAKDHNFTMVFNLRPPRLVLISFTYIITFPRVYRYWYLAAYQKYICGGWSAIFSIRHIFHSSLENCTRALMQNTQSIFNGLMMKEGVGSELTLIIKIEKHGDLVIQSLTCITPHDH